MTDLEIIKLKVNLSESQLDSSKKELLYQELLKHREAFSSRDEIGSCPFFEVSLKLKDDTPFFVRPYPIREDMKPIVQKEMDRLERLGIIKKGLTGYSSPVLLVKRKNQPLPRVVMDFRILNEKLVKVNHAFPLVRDCVTPSAPPTPTSTASLIFGTHSIRSSSRKTHKNIVELLPIMGQTPTIIKEWVWACHVHLEYGNSS